MAANDEAQEYMQWKYEFEKNAGKIQFTKVVEIYEDLFNMPKEYSLAYCVGADFKISRGIAADFRLRVDDLTKQQQSWAGGLGVLLDNEKYIYYLVTKNLSSDKSTTSALFSSLMKMRKHLALNKIEKLAMPRIGCGVDGLKWAIVKNMIEFVFRNEHIEIIKCNPMDF